MASETQVHDVTAPPCLCTQCRRELARERRSKDQPDDLLRRLALLVSWATALENRGKSSVGEVTQRFLDRHSTIGRSTLFALRKRFNKQGLDGLVDGRANNGGRNRKSIEKL